MLDFEIELYDVSNVKDNLVHLLVRDETKHRLHGQLIQSAHAILGFKKNISITNKIIVIINFDNVGLKKSFNFIL